MTRTTLFLVACAFAAGCGSSHDMTDHTNQVTQGPHECETPEDAAAPADQTIEARYATVKPDGVNAMNVITFGGTVPGPVLTMDVGQTRRYKLTNRTDVPIGLHFLGLSYDVKDDGTPLYPKSIVYPGCSHVYTMTAKTPGVFPFVDHLNPTKTMPAGMYGAVVVRAPGEPAVDKEYVYLLGELGQEHEGGHEEEEEEEEGGGARTFFMTMNGRTEEAPLAIERNANGFVSREGFSDSRVGNTVRFRLLNVSPSTYHSFGMHGYNFCDRGGTVDASGGCPNQGRPVNIVSLSPLEGMTVELRTDNPGLWMIHCHVLDHVAEGMMSYFDVK